MATLKDIANACNLNISTVSRALADKSSVNPKTKELILSTASKLNYVPNFSAKALAGGKTKTIGLLTTSVNNNYRASQINFIERELNERGYSLIIGIGDFNCEKELGCIETFCQRSVDGIIMVGPFSNSFNDRLPSLKRKLTMPTVIIQANALCSFATNITMDDDYGISLAITHLKELGHSKIGYISETKFSNKRLLAFKRIMNELKIPINEDYISIGNGPFEIGGYDAMCALIEKNTLPTAIFSSCDNVALGVMKALHDYKIKIPEEISIVGYDSIKESAYFTPSLTTVAQPAKELTMIAVPKLIKQIEDDEGPEERIYVYPNLIERCSTSTPPTVI